MKKQIIIEILIWFIILTILFCLGIFAYSKFFVEPNVYTIEFKDINGITKGSPVRFMGINIGYVRKMEIEDKSVYVQIIVTKKDMKIPNGTTARVEFYGLGGSKSIELMPPDGACDVGILTGSTIRIHDVVHGAKGIVSILEVVQEIVRDINPSKLEKIFENVKDLKAEQLKNVDKEILDVKMQIDKKAKEAKDKQSEVLNKVDAINDTVEKINKFIKK